MSQDIHPRKRPVVTLDGLSGSGKSTLARHLATALGWAYLDSGAWYRALTWATLQQGADPTDSRQVLDVLSRLSILSTPDGQVVVNDATPGEALRTPQIDASVSEVADHPAVRAALTERMRGLREHPDVLGVVADGRDAGSVIFPDAGLKVFVEVALQVRAARRFAQQQDAGVDSSLQAAQAALATRDGRDAQRGEAAPQVHAGDKVLHNDKLSVEEAIRRLLSWTHAVHGIDQEAT
jgi:cytidylate kinase